MVRDWVPVLPASFICEPPPEIFDAFPAYGEEFYYKDDKSIAVFLIRIQRESPTKKIKTKGIFVLSNLFVIILSQKKQSRVIDIHISGRPVTSRLERIRQ